MTFFSALRWCAYGSMVLTAFVMLYPHREFLGVDFSSHIVQSSAFALNALLFAVIENARPEVYLPYAALSDLRRMARVRWARHTMLVMVLFVMYAGLLELGQFIAPSRIPGITGFADNAASVLLTTAIVYIVVRIILSNQRIRRVTVTRLRSAAVSLRSEASYAGMLRDAIQKAYADSFAALPAEMRVARMAKLLSDALGLEMPKHSEDLLNTAYGVRRNPDVATNTRVLTEETSFGAGSSAVATESPSKASPGHRWKLTLHQRLLRKCDRSRSD